MNFENQVAKLCYDKYSSLKNSGKPRDYEWTVLSAIVLKSKNKLAVISLCTGTKCLSGSDLKDTSLYKRGSRLSDSHAEILARRGFLRYLYQQLNLILSKEKSEIFRLNEKGEIQLLENTTFHFFSSQSPCGDCSIIPKISHPCKIPKLEVDDYSQVEDIYRTGGKCLTSEKTQDTYEPGTKYHVLGPLRTKPGRGDRTLSLSCSDKIAKWIVTGLQGSLLSILIPTIRLDSIIIGGGCPFSKKSMERGLYTRFKHDYEVPCIYQADLVFSSLKSETRNQACPSSIIWCQVSNRNTEIAVEGRKQGATKKVKKGNYLLISRVGLLENFFDVFEKSAKFVNHRHPKKITYHHCKQAARSYQKNWNYAKNNIFISWPTKPPELKNFTL